jgi:hypothetical protein
VHALHETECVAEAWASARCEADTRGELLEGFRPCSPRVASLLHMAIPPKRRGRPANALRFTNQPSDHGDHGCQEAYARRPRHAARTFKHGSGTPHKYGCGIRMPHCHGRLLLLCATCAQATVPALGRAGHVHVLVIGSCCAPARLEMHCQSSIQSTVHASRVQTRLLARPGSDLASDPCLRVRMPRGVITQWGPGSSRPCRPCAACLWGSGNLFTSPLYFCLVAALHKSVVRSWRPTCLARECNYAQKNSSAPTNGLVYTTHVWLQSVRCVLSLGRAGSVRTVCSGTLPTLGRIAPRLCIDSRRKLGPCKSNDTVVPSVVSLVPAGGGASRPCACTA